MVSTQPYLNESIVSWATTGKHASCIHDTHAIVRAWHARGLGRVGVCIGGTSPTNTRAKWISGCISIGYGDNVTLYMHDMVKGVPAISRPLQVHVFVLLSNTPGAPHFKQNSLSLEEN